MANEEFEELIEKRKDWVRSSKENNFDFDNILAGLYNDPSHFIYEILQNAEDEEAKEVRFELFDDRLDVYHNGKDFDLRDIEGVTGIGISTKKEDLNLIGKFGVGFKSVFAITETPHIFSGEFKIKIEDFVIPSVINSSNSISETLIRLPFNHQTRSSQEVFALIANKLEKLGFKTLLFLKNIKEIKWQTSSARGHYLKSSDSLQNIRNAKKETIISSSSTKEYIVIEKPIRIEGKDLKVEAAYKLGKDESDKEIIIPEPDSKLIVFFSTEKVTFLNFIIQGPYKTTPTRENIPLDDEQNKAIIEETGNLIAESLSVIKKLGYLNTNFLNILPIKEEHKTSNQIYPVIYEKVKEKFLSEELLPTSDGKYTKAGDAVLARGKELTEFLDKDDIQKLFGKKNWLDADITSDRTPELRDYLMKELEVVEVDFESFTKKISAEFLQTKADEWLIDFYSRLSERSDRERNILKTKPIIRLETNEHIAPFDNNGKVQIYLPAETKSNYKTVKLILTENENSLRFLKTLGLTKPDLFAEIKEFILPKYQTGNPAKDEGYFEDFEKLLRANETIPTNQKKEFMEELSKASFIDSVNNVSGENCLCKPYKIYLPDKDLKNYFDGYSVYFVSDELYKRFEEERLKSFFIDVGVEDKPRRIEIDANLSREEKNRLRCNRGHTRDNYQRDYEYEGLNSCIEQITLEKSILLWKLLLKNVETYSSWQAVDFFKGKYSWYYNRRDYVESFDSKFLKILKQQAWLFDKNNKFRKPSEITLSELSDGYIKESPNIDVLKKILKFKPDIYDQIPEDVRERYEITKDIPIEELKKFASAKKEPSGKEEKTWIPEHEPDTVEVKIKEVEGDNIVTPDLTGQGEQVGTAEDEKPTDKDKKTTKEDVHEVPIDKKAIGKWGEKYVYYALKKNYQQKHGSIVETDSGFKAVNVSNEEFEIIWLNKHNDKGKGCDFVVNKNGTETEYIEVKTKTQEADELISTGTQWEFARKLFEQNEGEKYSFYVVLNAGKENAQIHILKNPIALWKEGKLYAHPVNFEL
ncbi:MAG: hypothetical protein A3I04_00600 [Nitrospinae bacterium RIFCSPLOWO2_02_FULL_39_110]|nr:MAG: hypothetical protein A3I04_00600 [Nitrospinae bacterium RIFCSPLOWO2_02_FULL_39_110]